MGGCCCVRHTPWALGDGKAPERRVYETEEPKKKSGPLRVKGTTPPTIDEEVLETDEISISPVLKKQKKAAQASKFEPRLSAHSRQDEDEDDTEEFKGRNSLPVSLPKTSSFGKTEKYYKILLMGKQGSGKSSIMERFMKNERPVNVSPTKSTIFKSRQFRGSTGESFRVRMFEVPMAETAQNARASEGAIIVVDLTDPSSLTEAIDFQRRYGHTLMKNCTVVIVGTKSDDADVQVPEEALTKFARDVEACSFVISAHTGDGFDSMLNYTIESIIKKFKIR